MMKLANASLVLSTATFGLMLGVAQNAQAGTLITGVTVSAPIGITTNVGWSENNLVNGSGLPGGTPSLGGIHALSAGTNAWRSNNGFPTAAKPIQLVFTLGNAPIELTGISFWNATGTSSERANGVRAVTFQYSTDGTNFSALNPIAFNGVAGAWTGSFLQGGSVPGRQQTVDFNLVNATHVRLNINSNYGGQRIGFNEIQFESIPEPSASLALLALGLAGAGLRKRI